ncbi:urease accessory protein UreF [Salinarimonas soli]|uniref:Urease accessory protein UreF n=2 Tax=Salinarimonas soli TaxID=1638099 RepID=A0A5B2VVQ8_9HYPH|nr:urease accessory protein UreF [Salinarimonas soli]
MVWLSPAFPVGAFAYSHGLEWAFEAGDLGDAAALEGWLSDLVAHGALRNDAILLAAAYRAVVAGDEGTLAEVAELSLALSPSAERRLETVTQGSAFLLAIGKSWPCAAVEAFARATGGDAAYPVAVGVAAAGHGLPLTQTLQAYALAFAANLVSAAVRLGVVGQTDGQRITAALLPALVAAAGEAGAATLDDLGGSTFRSDLASLRHETQYTRLFRS